MRSAGSGEAMNGKLKSSSDHLFALPDFWSGAARAIDLGGTFDTYRTADAAEFADQDALGADWATVGVDMQEAILFGK